MDEPVKKIPGGSGFQNAMGYEIELRGDIAVVTLDLSERHLNRSGIAHGGTIMSMFDVAMGWATAVDFAERDYRGLATVSLTTNFIGRAEQGAVRVEARKSGGGRKLVFCEAHAYNDAGDLIATATGTFRRFIRKGDEEKKTLFRRSRESANGKRD